MEDIVTNISHVQRVKDEHEKGLVTCLQKIRQWKKFREDYEGLYERLNVLPNKLTYDIMVPFGSYAFMPGTMVHTNKVTVLLGDNWFADVSSKQASEIALRRIKQCDKMLNDLDKEKKQFENWLGYISDVTNQELVEIKEEYDPEKEKLWREQHAKNVREDKRKAAEERKTKESEVQEVNQMQEPTVQTLENYFSRFESEEEEDITNSEEEEEGEVENAAIEDESTETNSTCTSEVTEDSKNEETKTTTEDFEQNVNTVDSNIVKETKKEALDNNKGVEENENSVEAESSSDSKYFYNSFDGDQKRHVRWIDLSEAKSKRITFTHSTLKSNNSKKKFRRRRKSSSTSEVEEEEMDVKTPLQIASPSDIYKCFSFTLHNSKPKSILKTINSDPVPPDTSYPTFDPVAYNVTHKVVNRTECKKRASKLCARGGQSNMKSSKRYQDKGCNFKKAQENISKEKIRPEAPLKNAKHKDDQNRDISVDHRTVSSESHGKVSNNKNCETAKLCGNVPTFSEDSQTSPVSRGNEDGVIEINSNVETNENELSCDSNNAVEVNGTCVKNMNGETYRKQAIFCEKPVQQAFTGEVCERTSTSVPLVQSWVTSRPKSLFKGAHSTRA